MPQPISLFSSYKGKENRITNYCLLMLKLLYEENPKLLARALGEMLGPEVQQAIGVQFHQQGRDADSIPDGSLQQEPLLVRIETKLRDDFSEGQLSRHLKALSGRSGRRVLIALGTFNDDGKGTDELLARLGHGLGVTTKAVSYTQFLAAIRVSDPPIAIQQTLDEFETFLGEEDLLTSWRDWMDVVNCAGTYQIQIDEQVYLCPADGGAYSHRPCRYFGLYQNKAVRYVAEILAVVWVGADRTSRVTWHQPGEKARLESHRQRAVEMVFKHEWARPAQAFLLGPMFSTRFVKDTKGGMLGSKQYFDVSDLDAADAKTLAAKLEADVRSWSNLPGL
ncbi:MAG: hypothetical protein SF028_07450 [Candidatus Sumerlaeia bacterium]|nr:hypothetical protein [Candidatus Sumerlaeia bacterium]